MTTSRSDLEMFTGSGLWAPVESDREGLRCAEQQKPTIAGGMTLRAYFDTAGKLAELSTIMEDGQRMEFDPQEIGGLAAQHVEVEERPSRSRTLGRGKFSTRG